MVSRRSGEKNKEREKEIKSARRIDLNAVITCNNKQQVSLTSQINMAKYHVGVL